MNPIGDAEKKKLIQSALDVRQNAHAKYSGFQVGAAVLTFDGHIITGANVENSSFGLTVCAERVAISSALSQGHRDFSALAIASPGGASPCGACRQFASEFCNELPVLLVDSESPDQVQECSLSDLLPDSFRFGK